MNIRPLLSWFRQKNAFSQLQWVYFGIIIAGIFVAGLLGLINIDLSRSILEIISSVLLVYAVNFITRAVIETILRDTSSVQKR